MPKKIRKRPAKGTGPAFPEGQFGCHAGLFGDFPVSRGVSVLPFCSSPPPGNAVAPRIRIAFDRGRAADQLPRAVLRRTRPGIFLHRHGSVARGKSAGEGQGFLSEVPLRWDDTPAGGCPPGVAVRTGEICVVNRLSGDPQAASWQSAAGKYGIRSFASVRIDVKKSSPLVLSLGSGKEDAFDRLEMEAIAAMACRVGTALFSARRHELFVCAKKSYGDLFRSPR